MRQVRPITLLAAAAVAAWLIQGVTPLRAQQAPPPAPLTDLDTFMARVLERRNENWKTLHDYILSERESFRILGPGDVPLLGQRREFSWFVRDGYLVRSPVKANGAALGEDERRRYEADWLADERKREEKARLKAAKGEDTRVTAADRAGAETGQAVEKAVVDELRTIEPGSGQEVVDMVGGEPRFISEAYFMKFPFEPGNYYLAGRETMDGRAVLKVEYYPSRLFKDEPDREKTEVTVGATPGGVTVRKTGEPSGHTETEPARKPRREDDDLDREIEAAMNKVTLVTMWIDPQEHQIVRFTFDNADWGYLPGRAIVRVDEARASMTMGRFFDGVWLPKEITFRFGATFASGSYTVGYAREFYDYRKGEVSARIRAYVPKEP